MSESRKNNDNSADTGFPGLLEEMNMDDIAAFAPEVVVLPLGSTEPHGNHLPYGTDTYQITATCRLGVKWANREGARALLYPTLPITCNANMRRHPFALRMHVRTFMRMLIDIVVQCREDGINKVVICNGHGGNTSMVDATLREIAGMDNMPFVCCNNGVPPAGYVSPIKHRSDHAGEAESSMMLAVRPDLVRTEKFTDNPFGRLKAPLLAKTSFVRPWHLYLPAGAGGETRESTAEKGRTIIEANARGLADILIELTNAKFDRNFPYAGL